MYDSELKQILYATGHPAPWNGDQRQGENRWTSGILARDVVTGEVRWFVGVSPHDPFAFGAGAAGVLLDTETGGAPRRRLLHADPNGYVYTIDRETGAVLSAGAFVNNNAAEGVDGASGALRLRSDRSPRENAMQRDICPGWPGALAAPATLSPDGRLLLIPTSRLCMDFEPRTVSYIRGTAFVGADTREKTPADGYGGALIGWSVAANKPVWTALETFPIASTPLIQSGAAVYGTLDGLLKSVDLATGRPLGERRLGSGVVSPPVAFRDAEGRDNLAVVSGLGGVFGLAADPSIDRRDATAAQGVANVRPLPPRPKEASGMLHVFTP